MEWDRIHAWATEFDLWSSVAINTWFLLTATALIVSRVLKGKLSPNDVLIAAGAMLALVGIAAFVAFGWVVFMAALYQSLFGPPPVWMLGIFWTGTTALLFWLYWNVPPAKAP